MIRPVFEKKLVRAGEMRSFQISVGPIGWEAAAHYDQHIAWRHRHEDWHQVERTRMRFDLEIAALRREGWLES